MPSTETDAQHPAHRIGTIVAIACIVLVLAGAAAFLLWPRIAENAVGGVPSFGGPFTLTTQTGARLSAADLKGEPFAVFFGFTRCPEVCPTTLWAMTEALKTLGPGADRLKVLFITVDPTRDTPILMARYLQSFDKHIVGLTGTEAEIAAVAKEYGVYYQKVPSGDGDYTMNHTATVFLMDAKGQFIGTIDYDEDMASRLAKLRRLIGDTA